jgi:uncharacterized protein (TIGR03118 family)
MFLNILFTPQQISQGVFDMHKPTLLKKSFAAIALLAMCSGAWRAEAASYFQTNLVSDIPGLATVTDPQLQNPWGMAELATSPIWSSNQAANTATLYNITGSTTVSKVNINPPAGFVAIPTTANGPQGPTGIVSNANTAAFQLVPGMVSTSSRFIFANLNGTISGWAGGLTATIQATTAGANYTGLAINQAQTQLYAANNAGTGGINVFNSSFVPVTLAGNFVDPFLPAGLVPFNVQDIGGKVYVTYAPAGRTNQINATAGMGAISVFGENGVFQQQLVSGGQLAAPWGLALAPASFGQFGGDLLVGNRSSVASEINAFDPTTGAFKGTIPIDIGSNTGAALWALIFGNGAAGGDPNTLYFTDGINFEADGLFGAIQVVTPIPAALPLFATGLGAALGLLGWRRKKAAS